MSASIPEKISLVRQQIGLFEKKYQRPEHTVRLLAVSKNQHAEKILLAHESGLVDFGENYLQEALGKMSALTLPQLCWHFIGPIQSNKTKAIAENFSWVHSVDRLKIARRLSEQRPEELAPLKILLQVNIDDEASKAGVSLTELPKLAEQLSELPRIIFAGLMCIPFPHKSFAAQRAAFRLLADARNTLQKAGHTECRELSMGMSNDYEAAIAEGATIVRIGSDIFGAR